MRCECEGVETRGGVVEELSTSDDELPTSNDDVAFSPKTEHTAINKGKCL